jgi:uncharacterized LabA/DUF88 family protein
MRTIIYVDGFNLYFRLLQKRPALKWLNIKALAEHVLKPINQIVAVRYYTARVSARSARHDNKSTSTRWRRSPKISVHLGMFLTSEKFAGLVHPPQFRPTASMPQPWPDLVKVLKVEEKGSDVNLACHLLLDAFQGNFDVAAVLSNDSDLVEPIRIVTQVLRKPVGLLSPVSNPNPELSRASSFIRRLSLSDLAAAQFPSPLPRAGYPDLIKPAVWM